jgi:hypothetical protein
LHTEYVCERIHAHLHTRTLSWVPTRTRAHAYAHVQGAECRNCPTGHFGHGGVHEACEVCPAGSHAPLEKHVTVFEHKLPEGFTTVYEFFLGKITTLLDPIPRISSSLRTCLHDDLQTNARIYLREPRRPAKALR